MLYFIFLRKYLSFLFKLNFIKTILKIFISTLLMSAILTIGLDYFTESLDYFNKYKSIYLLFIVSFVATIYLISCYLLGVLKIKNYKTN